MKLQKAVKPLEHLDAHGIAHFLRKHGITGDRGSAWTCPISRYLSLRTDKSVSAGLTTATVIHGADQISLPTSVQEFIRKFDDGEITL